MVVKPAPQQSRHLGPGDKLGKYDLIRQIAIGGMAELYLARTVGIEGFEKLVVIKRILPQFASNASFVNMFLNEARLAATLHHPNIAQVYDIGVEDGDYFFAMEYVHGEDLDRISIGSHEQGVPLSLDAALTLTAGLCAGLHYAHERIGADGRPLQIVHRDVSPSNVLVSYDGAVKLVDFGIARGAQAHKTPSRGGLKGKIVYMSPEQCRADVTIDRRSDIYSIGTLLYELTVGHTPFIGETEYAILNQIVSSDVPPPRSIVPDYPPVLEAIVMRACARDRDKRFPTAVALQAEIEDFAHENRLRVSPLVLARLMGTLFPARLEEWVDAKSQGAFFVEQHVVRTLIEAGKTPDPNDPEVRKQIKAIQAQLGESDATELTEAPVQRVPTPVRESAPDLPPPPVVMRAPTPIPAPQPTTTLSRSLTPVPQHPYQVAQAGRMVTHPGTDVPASGEHFAHAIDGAVPIAQPHQFDVTDRVVVPRLPTPTNFVRAPRKKAPLVALIGLAAIAGGVATFIAFASGTTTVAATTTATPLPIEAPPLPAPARAPAPAPAPVALPDPAPPPQPVAEPPPPPPTPAPVVQKPIPVVKKSIYVRPKPKTPAKKAEEKPAWDADSPFMPVRTDKH